MENSLRDVLENINRYIKILRGSNFTLNNRVTTLENNSGVDATSGWAVYNDTTYTTGSPFLVTAGAPAQALPNNAGSKIESQLPSDVTSFYDGTTIPGQNGDAILITMEFQCRPVSNTSNIRLKTSIDIGGTVGEIYPFEFQLSKGQGVEHYFLKTISAYTLNTWEANGGTVLVEAFNSDIEVYNIRYVISRTHKAR